jgi:hypothetical protein
MSIIQKKNSEFSVDIGLSRKIFTACCFKFHPQSTASDFERVYDCIVLSPALQSSPQIVIPMGEVTDEPQQITRIFLGTQFLWSGMLSENSEHLTVCDHRSQLNNRGQSVFTFEQ